jgi:hypothetical protein
VGAAVASVTVDRGVRYAIKPERVNGEVSPLEESAAHAERREDDFIHRMKPIDTHSQIC